MDTTKQATDVRWLRCACCGDSAGRWKQHWNRDDGYGVCVRCVGWIRERNKTRADQTDIERNYGVEGVNWGA